MPVYDVDGGLNFQGYSPRQLTGRLPHDQTATLPFYPGGSHVPPELIGIVNGTGAKPQPYQTAGGKKPIMSKVRVIPSMRK